MSYNKSRGAGFTLVELLAVIAIIGILATVVLVSLSSARSKARDAKRISEVDSLRTAIELYYNDKGHYPKVTAGGCWLTIVPGAENCGGAPDKLKDQLQSYYPGGSFPGDDTIYKYALWVNNTGTLYHIRTRVENKKNVNAGTWCYYVGSLPYTGENQDFCN